MPGSKKNTCNVITFCPVCKTRIRKDHLEKHLRRVHPDHGLNQTTKHQQISSKASNQPPSKRKRNQKIWALSHLTIQEKVNVEQHPYEAEIVDNMINHWVQEHPEAQRGGVIYQAQCEPEVSLAEQMELSLGQSIVRCEICGRKLKKSDMNAHRRIQHPKAKMKKNEQNLQKKKPQLKPKNKYAEGISSNTQVLDDRCEGGDPMAHYAREFNGQFGSFPLHDNYDDEARA